MKKLLLVLVLVALTSFLFVGCLPDWLTPEPVVPAPVMEAVALAELLEIEGEWTIAWSIVNTGEVFIREYELAFKVDYPDVERDCVVVEIIGEYLEVGDIHSDYITLLSYGEETPESVSVEWELLE